MSKIIQKRQILLVEDQKIIREGLRALISNVPEFEVVGEAENGFEAIKAFKNYEPDIVLMDLSMPKMNGVEATKHIKRINQDARILVLTSHCAEKCVRESLTAGASGFLDKLKWEASASNEVYPHLYGAGLFVTEITSFVTVAELSE